MPIPKASDRTPPAEETTAPRLSLRQAQCLAGYLARRLVGKVLKQLRVERRRRFAVHEVRGLHAEGGSERPDLAYRGVGDPPGPEASTSSAVSSPALMQVTSALV